MRDGQCREHEIERRAVQVEGVARGDDEARDALGDAEGDELLEELRQRGLAARGRECREHRVANRLDERADLDAEDEHDRNEDHDEEDDEREVQAADEERVLTHQVNDGGPSLEHDATVGVVEAQPRGHVAHVGGDGTEHAEGREHHDEVGVLEHRLRDAVEEREHRLAALADAREREAEERGEDDDREDVAFRGVLDEVRGEGVERDVPARLRGLADCDGGVRAEIEREVRARLYRVRDDETDDERQRGDDLEVEESLGPHPPDGLDVAGLCDPDDNGREEQRHDEPLDQPDEAFGEKAERLVRERMRVLRQEPAECDAERETRENPERRRPLPSAAHEAMSTADCHRTRFALEVAR